MVGGGDETAGGKTKFDLEELYTMANSNVVSMKALLEAGVQLMMKKLKNLMMIKVKYVRRSEISR